MISLNYWNIVLCESDDVIKKLKKIKTWHLNQKICANIKVFMKHLNIPECNNLKCTLAESLRFFSVSICVSKMREGKLLNDKISYGN